MSTVSNLKKKKSVFCGCATALITPFKNGNIDFDAMKRLIDRQTDGGVSALVVCGTTGEGATLTEKEHYECIEFVKSNIKSDIPVIAGCGSNSTSKAVALAKNAEKAGGDALLAVTPYYNKATDDGLYRHFTEIADATDKPLILYNVPPRTGVNLSAEVASKLSAHPNIVGIKDASGNVSQTADLISACGDALDVYSGNDDQILPVLSLGGAGVISVVSNLLPSETAAICTSFFSNDTKKARELQIGLLPLIRAMFCEVNPIPVKYASYLMGLCESEIRLPLCLPTEKSKERIAGVLQNYVSI